MFAKAVVLKRGWCVTMARFSEREIQFASSRWKDLDAEISEWDECRLYLPSGVSKNIVTQISGANKLLAALELYMIERAECHPVWSTNVALPWRW